MELKWFEDLDDLHIYKTKLGNKYRYGVFPYLLMEQQSI